MDLPHGYVLHPQNPAYMWNLQTNDVRPLPPQLAAQLLQAVQSWQLPHQQQPAPNGNGHAPQGQSHSHQGHPQQRDPQQGHGQQSCAPQGHEQRYAQQGPAQHLWAQQGYTPQAAAATPAPSSWQPPRTQMPASMFGAFANPTLGAAQTTRIDGKSISLGKAFVGAAIGAVAGAILWGIAGLITGGWEFKYGAIVIGVLTGAGAALLGGGQSKMVGVLGGVAGLFGLIAGKLLFNILVFHDPFVISYHLTAIDFIFYAATVVTGFGIGALPQGEYVLGRARQLIPFVR